MKGNVTRRSTHSWRLTFDVGRGAASGKRKVHSVTVRGTKREAQAELTRLMAAHSAGTLVGPTKVTVDRLSQNVARHRRRSASRHDRATVPGADPAAGHPAPGLAGDLQKLRPADIAAWHAALIKAGGKDGRPLSAQTVQHMP